MSWRTRRYYDKRIITGSYVVITNGGHSYTSWHEQAEHMKLTHYLKSNTGPYEEANAKTVGRVIAVCPHPSDNHTLYGVRFEGEKTVDYLINEDGVKFHTPPTVFDEDLFTI